MYSSYKLKVTVVPSSHDKILSAAKECFFQHGYTAANISMIGRYADISRVTIHKQFKSKEVLFRAVVENHIAESQERLDIYKQSTNNFWLETEALIIARCSGLFDEIKSAQIRTDLLHAGQVHCEDIISDSEQTVRDAISLRITNEIATDQMTLERVGISTSDLSRIIESAPFGLVLSSADEDNIAYVSQLMKVFKASTSV